MITKNKAQEIAREAVKEIKLAEQARREALRKDLLDRVMRDADSVDSLIEAEIIRAASQGKSRTYIPYECTEEDDILILNFLSEDGEYLTPKYSMYFMVAVAVKGAGYSIENFTNSQKIKISWNWRGNRNPEEEETA